MKKEPPRRSGKNIAYFYSQNEFVVFLPALLNPPAHYIRGGKKNEGGYRSVLGGRQHVNEEEPPSNLFQYPKTLKKRALLYSIFSYKKQVSTERKRAVHLVTAENSAGWSISVSTLRPSCPTGVSEVRAMTGMEEA